MLRCTASKSNTRNLMSKSHFNKTTPTARTLTTDVTGATDPPEQRLCSWERGVLSVIQIYDLVMSTLQ